MQRHFRECLHNQQTDCQVLPRPWHSGQSCLGSRPRTRNTANPAMPRAPLQAPFMMQDEDDVLGLTCGRLARCLRAFQLKVCRTLR